MRARLEVLKNSRRREFAPIRARKIRENFGVFFSVYVYSKQYENSESLVLPLLRFGYRTGQLECERFLALSSKMKNAENRIKKKK